MEEIAEIYAIDVEKSPIMDRCSGDLITKPVETDARRIFTIGASHTNRLLGGLADSNLNIVNLAKAGWVLDENSAEEIKNKLRIHKVWPEDILEIDPVSNSTFCGTDRKGNPADPEKINDKWHITGELCTRSKSYVKNTLNKLNFIRDSYPDNAIILMVPIPRYVTQNCCVDKNHITNRSDPSFEPELMTDLEVVEDLITAWGQSHGGPSHIINFRTVTDEPDANLSDLKIGGSGIWLESDPVHATLELYAALAQAIAATCATLASEESLEPATKRQRLESVVVTREKPATSNTGVARPQSWSTGQLPVPQPSGLRPRGQRGYFGGQREIGPPLSGEALGVAAAAVAAGVEGVFKPSRNQ
jgi:hypothetical protein